MQNINTPFKFDIKERVKNILSCPNYFALIDDSNGLNVRML